MTNNASLGIARNIVCRATVERHSPAIVAVVALHVGLIAILLTSSIHAGPTAKLAAMTMRAFPAPAVLAHSLPPAPTFAVIAADIPMPILDTETPAQNCTLIGAIATALVDDGEVGAALAAQPDTTALMVWDGRWSNDATPAIAPIRRVVVDQIRSSSPLCRSTGMLGPRLFMVPNGTKTVAVAIGSGTWSWRQLLS